MAADSTLGLPQRLKIGESIQPKHLFNEAVCGLIPDAIIDWPKRGFRVPAVD